jgi:hypothetical protein
MSLRRAIFFLALPLLGGCHDGGLKVPRIEGVTASMASPRRRPRK